MERDPALDEQQDYYCARAGEYDDWFFRRGRYDRGPEATQRWFEELATVEEELRAQGPLGRCLELACATGLWTRHLVELASTVTVIDGSAEMLAECRKRLPSAALEFVQEDLFAWTPKSRYDFIFFSF